MPGPRHGTAAGMTTALQSTSRTDPGGGGQRSSIVAGLLRYTKSVSSDPVQWQQQQQFRSLDPRRLQGQCRCAGRRSQQVRGGKCIGSSLSIRPQKRRSRATSVAGRDGNRGMMPLWASSMHSLASLVSIDVGGVGGGSRGADR